MHACSRSSRRYSARSTASRPVDIRCRRESRQRCKALRCKWEERGEELRLRADTIQWGRQQGKLNLEAHVRRNGDVRFDEDKRADGGAAVCSWRRGAKVVAVGVRVSEGFDDGVEARELHADGYGGVERLLEGETNRDAGDEGEAEGGGDVFLVEGEGERSEGCVGEAGDAAFGDVDELDFNA